MLRIGALAIVVFGALSCGDPASPTPPVEGSPVADLGSASDTGASTPDTGAPAADGGQAADAGAVDSGVVLGPPRVETVVGGLNHPWGMSFLPDGRALITERGGRLRILDTQGRLSGEVSGVPSVYASGQGGLLDVLVGPSFARDRLVYLCYAAQDGRASGTEVARARLEDDRLGPLEVVFQASPKIISGSNHYGCRLGFDPEGHLFIGIGDRFGEMDRAQELDSHLGKIMRIWPDGSVPADNPFMARRDVLPEIWSYGHRNIQGLVIHPTTGEPWNHEHGPRGGDEVNRPQAGDNHGWPLACYGSHYTGQDIPDDHAGRGFAEPAHYWTPSIAPSGMAFYDGDLFPEWKGQLFVGALAGRSVRRLELEGNRVVAESRVDGAIGERIREIEMGPDGAIYLLTDDGNGQVLRITRDVR
ncbi:MAG: PQQ-dependent sugar dehydrogenase [Myxococcota bacterium]